MRFYVLWYYIYINDQSYELNKIINKDVLWFFIKLVLQKITKTDDILVVVPLLQDTTSYRKNNNVDQRSIIHLLKCISDFKNI